MYVSGSKHFFLAAAVASELQVCCEREDDGHADWTKQILTNTQESINCTNAIINFVLPVFPSPNRPANPPTNQAVTQSTSQPTNSSTKNFQVTSYTQNAYFSFAEFHLRSPGGLAKASRRPLEWKPSKTLPIAKALKKPPPPPPPPPYPVEYIIKLPTGTVRRLFLSSYSHTCKYTYYTNASVWITTNIYLHFERACESSKGLCVST